MSVVKVLKLKTIPLAIVAGMLLLVYAFFAVNAMRVEYRIEELSDKITELQKQGDKLRLQLSDVSSLDYILERSDSLSYTEIQKVSYIQKSSSSPFAAR